MGTTDQRLKADDKEQQQQENPNDLDSDSADERDIAAAKDGCTDGMVLEFKIF